MVVEVMDITPNGEVVELVLQGLSIGKQGQHTHLEGELVADC